MRTCKIQTNQLKNPRESVSQDRKRTQIPARRVSNSAKRTQGPRWRNPGFHENEPSSPRRPDDPYILANWQNMPIHQKFAIQFNSHIPRNFAKPRRLETQPKRIIRADRPGSTDGHTQGSVSDVSPASPAPLARRPGRECLPPHGVPGPSSQPPCVLSQSRSLSAFDATPVGPHQSVDIDWRQDFMLLLSFQDFRTSLEDSCCLLCRDGAR